MKKIAFLVLMIPLLASCAGNGQFIAQATKEKTPIVVTMLTATDPNSAGGVSVFLNFVNTSAKTIKYAEFGFAPYNRVGDTVKSEIGGESFKISRYTGPLNPGQSTESFSVPMVVVRNLWYNRTISCVEIKSIVITYTDSTVVGFTADQLNKFFPPKVKNNCTASI